MNKFIENLNCTYFQKQILQIIYEFNEGWINEDELENKLKKLFNKQVSGAA